MSNHVKNRVLTRWLDWGKSYTNDYARIVNEQAKRLASDAVNAIKLIKQGKNVSVLYYLFMNGTHRHVGLQFPSLNFIANFANAMQNGGGTRYVGRKFASLVNFIANDRKAFLIGVSCANRKESQKFL